MVCTFVLSLRFCSSSSCCNCMFEARGSRPCSRILLAWNQTHNQPMTIVLSLRSGTTSTHHASVACACSRLDVIQSDVAVRLDSQTTSAEANAVFALSLHQLVAIACSSEVIQSDFGIRDKLSQGKCCEVTRQIHDGFQNRQGRQNSCKWPHTEQRRYLSHVPCPIAILIPDTST